MKTSGMDGRRLLEERRRRMQHDERISMEMEVLYCLLDARWHSSRELALKTSHRFSAYLWRLRHRHGVRYEIEEDTTAPGGRRWFRYRLTSLGGAATDERLS
jgi:hypothetical protein